jgi:hypothetical protein
MSHTFLITGLVIIVLVVVAGTMLKPTDQATKQQVGASAYEAIPTLLTAAERSFFGVLQQAVASQYQIFAKVRLADIVRPVRSPSRSGWQAAFNRITGKHVDFVLCDPAHLGIVAVVELDDSTHGRFERGMRDGLVDAALADAAIPVLRISARQAYSPTQIREQVKNIFVSQKKVENPISSS